MNPSPIPSQIKAPHGAPWVELHWPDASVHRIPTAILRGYCPCAGCQGHNGPITFQAGRDSELIELEGVGNYGLKLAWGDRHDTGIYTYRFLRQLGELYTAHGAALPERVPQIGR